MIIKTFSLCDSMDVNWQHWPAGQELTNEQEDLDAGEEEVNEVEEEELAQIERCETEFNFSQFVADFAHPDIVKNYSIVLAEFTSNSDLINHCAVRMLHRLSHDLGFVGMLFQASVFKTFNSLLNGPYAGLPRYKELSKFACYVVRQFTTIAQVNKKVFVDLMFWKNKNEAVAITNNYDFQTKSSGKVLWTEHDEEELTSLFEKFRDVHHPEKDTVDLIMGELTSSHTRMQVLRELKKQGLITSVKDIHKPRMNRRQRQAWTEEEVEELTRLFEEFKDSGNPLSDIMKSLSGSHGRSAVISKLLELHLVDDKSQLVKKRRQKVSSDGKPRNKRDRNRQSSNSEDSASSSNENKSDEEDYNDADDFNQPVLPVTELAKKVVESGYQNQLSWIQRGLRNTAEDRDEGSCVPTPLVAVTEESETAMEDERFLSFLRSLGISPPANEQEVFWRIPAEYSAGDLRDIADALEMTDSGDIMNANQIQDIVSRVFPKSANKNRKPKEEKKHKPRKEKRKKHADIPEPQGSNSSSEEGEFIPHIPHLAKGSDTSDSGLDSEIEAQEQKAIWMQKQGKKSKQVKSEERRNALKRLLDRKKAREAKPDFASEREISKVDSPAKDQRTNEETETSNGKEMSIPRETVKSKVTDSDSDTSSLSSLSADQSQTNISTVADFESETESRELTSSASAKTRKRFLDSESDSDSTSQVLKVDDKSKSKGKKVMKRVRMLASDDEEDMKGNDDEEESNRNEPASLSHTESTVKSSGDSFPATLLTQSLNSDEEDDHVPLRTAMKRKRAIEDSDED
ncbi:hypothetical protein Btru_012697 [Bulinus truncatus]|nr:hypothetical protein Btru_012697 [Bulinus truncatus]